MDLDGDGYLDILSGSYSRMSQPMAGEFQVLAGTAVGFSEAETLKGSDGEPLIIPADEDNIIRNICTRPYAVDLNGDGHLDIVSGNFEGTFFLFEGEGAGAFKPEPTQLEADGKPMKVGMHSDPFFIDWDGDGDQDMLSGSAQGGVEMFENVGTKTAPAFGKAVRLVAMHMPKMEVGAMMPPTMFGDEHIDGPQGSTRVWAADVNGDGKLDLLVGDSVTINTPADGLDEAEAQKQIKAWDEEMARLQGQMDAETGEMDDEVMQAWQAHWGAREKIMDSNMTGHVWVYYQQ